MTPTPTDALRRIVDELRADLTRACDYHETRNPTWTLAGAVRDRLRNAMWQIERLCATDAQEATAERQHSVNPATGRCVLCGRNSFNRERVPICDYQPPSPRAAAQEAPREDERVISSFVHPGYVIRKAQPHIHHGGDCGCVECAPSSSAPPVDVAALRALSGEMVHDAVTRAPSDPVRIALHDYIRKLDCLVGKHTSPDRKCSVHGTGECWCMP